jgi:signal peptide peptidase SppA
LTAALDAILDEPWALQPNVLRQIRAYLAGDTSVRAAIARTPAPPRTQGVIGIIPIQGVIEHRSSLLGELFGGTSLESLRAAFRAAVADPEVRGIVLNVDSPGGGVAGVTEMAAEIRAARGTKPIIAIADTVAASAAYWLASQADQVIATPSAQVGSIGIFGVHADISRALEAEGVTATVISAGEFKAEESEFVPLGDEARAAIQARVDATYETFVNDVAKGRGVTADRVRSDFGKGRVVLARDALAVGMIDGIDTLEGVMRRVSRSARGMAAEGGSVDLMAEGDDPLPFRERVTMLAADAHSLMEHGLVRAQLRAKEGRPPFSDAILEALRSTRDAVNALLPDEPAAAAPAVEPPPVVQAPKAPTAPRFRSQAEWIAYLERTHA